EELVPEQAQVEHRGPHVALDHDEERQQDDRGGEAGDHERIVPSGEAALRQREHEPGQADDVRARAEEVEAALLVASGDLVQHEVRPRRAGKTERHVEPEHPRPVDRDERAAEHGADDEADRGDHRVRAHREPELLLAERVGHERGGVREEECAADSLQHAPKDELGAAAREAGAERGGGEDEEAEHVRVLAAEEVGQPSRRQHEDGGDDHVDEVHPDELEQRRVEATLQVREGDDERPRVDGGEEHPQAGAGQDPPLEVTAVSATAKKLHSYVNVSLALSPTGFRRLACWTVGCLVLIVATGATVRLTGSGLGCPHWPTCNSTHALPKGYHSDVEFSNRVVSFFTVLSALALAVGAWRTPRLGRRGRLLATAVCVGTLAQAPLGAITVYYDLDPYLVISHLLLSLTVLGLGVLVVLEASRAARGAAAPLPALARAGGAALLAAVGVLVVTGTLSTAAGRFPGSSGAKVVPRLGAFHPAVWLHVRAVAAFGIVFIVLAAWAWRERTRFPWLVRACAGLLAILLAQMAIGEVQYRTYGTVPWWLVVGHVVAAACLFASTVGVVGRLWRPVAT